MYVYRALLNHQIKSFFRSSVWQRNMVLNILMVLAILYFASIFIFMGFVMSELLDALVPQKSATEALSRYIILYVLADFLSRFFMQGLPVLKIQPYLHLPLSRASLLHNILLRSIFNSFALLPLLLLIPFVSSVYESSGQLMLLIIWVFQIMIFLGASTLLLGWLKRYLIQNQRIIWLIIPVVGLTFYTGYAGILPWLDWSEWYFSGILKGNILGLLITLLCFVSIYLFNFRFLQNQIYPELFSTREGNSSKEFKLLGSLGEKGLTGALVMNEVKLILRNKRPKSVMMLSLFFCLYGLVFYFNKSYGSYSTMFLFAGIFTTGAFLIQYGQFLISWEASFMDGIFSRPLALSEWLRAKMWLMAGSVVFLYLLSMPIALYFGVSILKINTVCAIFNIGFNSFVMLTAATFNKKKVDLSKGSSFNWQGVGAAQWLVGIPILLIPVLIYFPFALFEAFDAALLTLSGIGLISLLSYKAWFAMITKNIQDRKFDTLSGFRQND